MILFRLSTTEGRGPWYESGWIEKHYKLDERQQIHFGLPGYLKHWIKKAFIQTKYDSLILSVVSLGITPWDVYEGEVAFDIEVLNGRNMRVLHKYIIERR